MHVQRRGRVPAPGVGAERRRRGGAPVGPVGERAADRIACDLLSYLKLALELRRPDLFPVRPSIRERKPLAFDPADRFVGIEIGEGEANRAMSRCESLRAVAGTASGEHECVVHRRVNYRERAHRALRILLILLDQAQRLLGPCEQRGCCIGIADVSGHRGTG